MYNLKEALEYHNLDFKTQSDLRKFGNTTSFFGNLAIGNKSDFIKKKTDDMKLTYSEWVEKKSSLDNKFNSIERFISNKKKKYITKLIDDEITKVTNSFSKLMKLQFIIMGDNYRERSGRGWYDDLLPITLDGYLEFLCNAQRFEYKHILEKINNILWLEDRDKKRTITRFTILRLMTIYKDDILNNITEATYKLNSSIYMLKPILKRSTLKSFSNDPHRLAKIVQYDSRHYKDTPVCSLTQAQAIEFSKFYLESTDKRLNTSNIIKELILHLLQSKRTDLIDELCLKHHRSFASVIAGEFTRKSYSYDILSFLRRVMSNEGYNEFNSLIDKDENEKFSNAIKINFNKSSEVEADY